MGESLPHKWIHGMTVNMEQARNGLRWKAPGPPASAMSAIHHGRLTLDADGSHFGFLVDGQARIVTSHGTYSLVAGMYFAVPGTLEVAMEGTGFVVTRFGWTGFFHVGGPVEEQGRLRYIDGCSDSLLIAPVVWGDPCLNLLYLPPHTQQTAHTHPSARFGVIISGSGVCKTPRRDFSLAPRMVFHIPADAEHSFCTEAESLRVIAWHPDSDFGPTHHDHPMINRTIIAGVPAAKRESTYPSALP